MAEITHVYVPKHVKLKQEEAEELLKRYNITTKQLPQISKKDAAVKELDVKKGDIIKITRNSPTNGEAIFYRIVQ